MSETVQWHALLRGPIKEPDEALAFVQACGFCTWGPLPRLSFPNLAEAMGETATSVLGRTWYWKDDLHFAQQLYYGKIIGGQPSFISQYHSWSTTHIRHYARPSDRKAALPLDIELHSMVRSCILCASVT